MAGLFALPTGCGGGSKSTTSTTSSTPSRPTVPTIDWPTYGSDQQRTRYLATKQVKPPFKVSWQRMAVRTACKGLRGSAWSVP